MVVCTREALLIFLRLRARSVIDGGTEVDLTLRSAMSGVLLSKFHVASEYKGAPAFLFLGLRSRRVLVLVCHDQNPDLPGGWRTRSKTCYFLARFPHSHTMLHEYGAISMPAYSFLSLDERFGYLAFPSHLFRS